MLPSGENAKAVTLLAGIEPTSSPVVGSHSFTQSIALVASRRPSGENAKAYGLAASKVSRTSPVSVFHSLTVPSELHEANVLGSVGENASDTTFIV